MELEHFIYTKYECAICLKLGSPYLTTNKKLYDTAKDFIGFDDRKFYENGFKHICRGCLISIAKHSRKIEGVDFTYGILSAINSNLKYHIWKMKLDRK